MGLLKVGVLSVLLTVLVSCQLGSEQGKVVFKLRFESRPASIGAVFTKTAAADSVDFIRVTAFLDGRVEAAREFDFSQRHGELLHLRTGTYQIVAEALSGGVVILSGRKTNVIVTTGRISDAGEIVLSPLQLESPTLDDQPPALTNVDRLKLTGTKPAGTGIVVNVEPVVAPGDEVRFSTEVELAEGRNAYSVAAYDQDGNESPPLNFTVVLDTQPPEFVSMAREGASVTNSQTVGVRLSANGNPVAFLWSFDSAFRSTNRTAFADRLALTLPAGDGALRLYGKVVDEAGNESRTLSVDYTLDTAPPSAVSIEVTGNPVAVTGTTVELDLSASGARWMQISESTSFAGSAWVTYATRTPWTFTRQGLNGIFARFKDEAGNLSATASASVQVNGAKLQSLVPVGGESTTSVTISGVGFGASQGVSRVLFGNSEADVVSWSDTSVVALVPAAAPPATVATVIDFGDARTNALPFEHKRPWIRQISPAHGAYPTQPALSGLYLGQTAGVVTVDGTVAGGRTWAPSLVEFYAPAFTGGAKAVTLETTGGFISNTVRFTYHGGDAWVAMQDAPVARAGHSAVWTGSEMIIYGGSVVGGGRYHPVSDSWLPVTPAPAFESRRRHRAIWTGEEMIVWGGIGDGSYANEGFRYRPDTDSWSTMSSTNAPVERQGHVAAWTGEKVVLWGGHDNFGTFQTGGQYAPATDTWQATSLTNAPSARANAAAAWTGKTLLVWGGSGDAGRLNDGAEYDPVSDSWMPLPTVGAPSGRTEAEAVWTGREFIVWGGLLSGDVYANDGGRYFPATGEWRDLPAVALSGRIDHTLTWTGKHMIVWGGTKGSALSGGAAYDPVADGWTALPAEPDPKSRTGHAAVFTGNEVLIWGGEGYVFPYNGGIRLDANQLTWSVMGGNPVGVPMPRTDHVMIWSGSELLVWGGTKAGIVVSQDGARYNPATETWTPITNLNAPQARTSMASLWLGSEMLIWGGCKDYDCATKLNDGGIYVPSIDSWEPITATTLQPRVDHAMVWTGSEAIVWGGWNTSMVGDGAAYDPVTDTWREMSSIGAPSARNHAAIVWTGEQALLWGGYDGNFVNTGSRYYPSGDTWVTMSVLNAPTGRADHSAVWSGTEMIAWGGRTGFHPDFIHYDTGGRYDPSTDTWVTMSTLNAPYRRGSHSALWTGSSMWIWGGRTGAYDIRNDGGLYDPATDSWRQVSRGLNVPGPARWPNAVWTGTEMIVWGGYQEGYLGTGSRYFP